MDGGEILILPVQDVPSQQSAQESSKTVYTPAAPALLLTGPVLVASRSNLVPSTDPLAASNVEVSSGWQWQPPSSPTPSTSDPTPPASNPVVINVSVAEGHGVNLSVPIIDTGEPSIVTINSDGNTTVDENSAATTAADLSKYTKGFLGGKTVSANGTIAVYSSATGSAKSEGNALDVSA